MTERDRWRRIRKAFTKIDSIKDGKESSDIKEPGKFKENLVRLGIAFFRAVKSIFDNS